MNFWDLSRTRISLIGPRSKLNTKRLKLEILRRMWFIFSIKPCLRLNLVSYISKRKRLVSDTSHLQKFEKKKYWLRGFWLCLLSHLFLSLTSLFLAFTRLFWAMWPDASEIIDHRSSCNAIDLCRFHVSVRQGEIFLERMDYIYIRVLMRLK